MPVSWINKMVLLAAGSGAWVAVAGGESDTGWRKFDETTIRRAREEKKLIFLNVEAVWCHWCHVMDKETFPLPEVQQALGKGFICTKLDQDSRPDLSRRYEEYGWPALVIIDPVTMKERAIASGFQTKEEFLELLKRGQNQKEDIGLHPAGEPAAKGALSNEQKQALLGKLRGRYDTKATGWGAGHKFIPWGNIEFCLRLAANGDDAARKMAEDTLTAALPLIDPVWGGLYQYSTGGDWVHPHFEKIMEYEAEVSRVYALAYQTWKRPADLKAAENIARHLRDFLRSPEGAYYVSQDADVVQGEHSADYFTKNDPQRRAIGIPRVDNHCYSRENGMAVSALVSLYQASGKSDYLADAKTAAEWIVSNRDLPGGGFRHDGKDSNGPFLADQVYMGRALLSLYQATADRRWLDRSVACADFCAKKFKRETDQGAGYFSGTAFPDTPAPVVDRDENIEMARWLNLLARTSRESRFGTGAEHAMRYLATDKVLGDIYSFTGGVLLADAELAEEPVHIAIVGKKDDPASATLFASAQKQPSSYKVIEWLEPGAESTAFPDDGKAAAYLCIGNRCSPPKFTAEELVGSFTTK